MRVAAMVGLALVMSCGDDGTEPKIPDASTIDGTPGIDAALVDAPPDAPTFVVEVTCPGTPDASITTTDSPQAFSPAAATISVNGIVRFSPSGSHNVIPRPGMPSDPGLSVGFGQTKCLQFTMAGTFHFRCQPHANMTGMITVN